MPNNQVHAMARPLSTARSADYSASAQTQRLSALSAAVVRPQAGRPPAVLAGQRRDSPFGGRLKSALDLLLDST
jgi:hypothetical protein